MKFEIDTKVYKHMLFMERKLRLCKIKKQFHQLTVRKYYPNIR